MLMVVVVLVIVDMIMAFAMRMIVLVVMGMMVVMGVAVPMVVIAAAVRAVVMMAMGMRFGCRGEVGAALGVKGSFHICDFCAAFGQDRGNGRIRPDADALAGKLHRQMVVAELPGDACEVGLTGRQDIHQRFRLAEHLDKAAVCGDEGIARADSDGAIKGDLDDIAAHSDQLGGAGVAALEIEHDEIGNIAGPITGGANGCGEKHGDLRKNAVTG